MGPDLNHGEIWGPPINYGSAAPIGGIDSLWKTRLSTGDPWVWKKKNDRDNDH